jgi:dTDP-4-dehydrorhamnose reductase
LNAQTNILVTGANGQLGMEFRALSQYFPAFRFHFLSRDEMSIDDERAVSAFVKENNINYFINCAAYTAVDKAESEKDMALRINSLAPGLLATICRNENVKLIHFSTDYVFDGNGASPYKETDATCPVNFYGETKLQGENNVLENNSEALIIRTSWVYSSYGKNFVKTILRLINEKEEISVVNDQSGCPTYAADLAGLVISLIQQSKVPRGIYHFANRGVITWYEFATAIKEISGSACIVNPIPTTAYPTPAKRPVYSAIDTEKMRIYSSYDIPEWRISLEKCIALITGV